MGNDRTEQGALTAWFSDHQPSTSFPIYSRANCAEVFPDPVSPLTQDYSWPGAGDEGLRRWMLRFTVGEGELDDHSNVMFEVYNAYMFINVSVARLMGARMPGMTVEMVDMSWFGTESQLSPYVPRPMDDDPAIAERLGALAMAIMTTTEVPTYIEEVKARVDGFVSDRPDLTGLDEADLLARLRETHRLFGEIMEHHSESSTSAGVALGAITGITMEMQQPGLDARIASGIGDVDSAAPSFALWELSRVVRASPHLTEVFEQGIDGLQQRLDELGGTSAEFKVGLNRFMAEFGSRAPNEWELRSDSWETKPELVYTLIDRMRLTPEEQSPQAGHDRAQATSADAIAIVREALAPAPEVLGMFEGALVATRVWMTARERTKTTIVKVVHEGRLAARELGARLAANGRLQDAGNIFMLRDQELETALAGTDMADTCAQREEQFAELAQYEPPFVWEGQPPPLSEWPRRDAAAGPTGAAGDSLTGMGGSPGTVTGTARIVLDPMGGAVLEPGDILVAPLTDPSWTPLFVPASAVVVDLGAMVSHSVIVSREFGIPCVVSAVGATRTIPDGATITVNGDTGVVTIDALP